MLVMINLTDSPIRNYKLSLTTSTFQPGEYIPISLLDDASPSALTILDNGRIF